MQLLKQQRLRYKAVVVLVQHKPDQRRTIMSALQIWRQLAHYIITTWCFIHLEPIADIEGFHLEILNHPIFIVFED